VVVRTLVDIGDAELKALDHLAKVEKVSRAALIRKAVGDFLDRNNGEREFEAFGLWGDRAIDGLAYQEKIRSEW
jgi:predicted transcriptional regulator